MRRLDQLEPQRLEGTEAALRPAWTPDSDSIGFGVKGDLEIVPLGGGTPTIIGLGFGDAPSW